MTKGYRLNYYLWKRFHFKYCWKEKENLAQHLTKQIMRMILRNNKEMESAISYWKKHSTYLRKRAYSLTCKWWLIALNPFSNQCSLKSCHALETNERKQGNAFYGHCKRGCGWSYMYVNLVRSVLESLVPNFTHGPSWSMHCCLRPWLSLFHLFYHLCWLLYAYLICEGVKGGW